MIEGLLFTTVYSIRMNEEVSTHSPQIKIIAYHCDSNWLGQKWVNRNNWGLKLNRSHRSILQVNRKSCYSPALVSRIPKLVINTNLSSKRSWMGSVRLKQMIWVGFLVNQTIFLLNYEHKKIYNYFTFKTCQC